MSLAYIHTPPGTVKQERADRLRTWDDSSPYHKGRPKRGPRGPGEKLRLIEKDFTWRNIPQIEEITVHSMISGTHSDDSAYLHVAGMAMQAITGVRPTVHRAKHSLVVWSLRKDTPISVSCNLRGDQAYDFIDRCINIVFPRIKEWEGIKGKSCLRR